MNYHYKGRGANDWEYLVTAYKPGQPSHKIRYDHFEKAFLAYLEDLDWRAVSNEAEPSELKVLTGRLNDVRSELDRTERAVARNQKLIDSTEEVPLSLFSAQDKAQARMIELQAERSRLEADAERIKSRTSVIDHPEELLAAIQSRDGGMESDDANDAWPNHEYTDQYPHKMPAKITVRLQDGKVIEHEVQDYPGLASHPFTWEDSVEKFDRLVADRTDEGLCGEIKDAVRSLESIQVRDLINLLGQLKSGHQVDQLTKRQ